MPRWIALFVVAACGHDTPPAPEVNPLGSTADILPYPSSLYERADATSPTGVRLDVPSEAIPLPATRAPFDPTRVDQMTGWPSALTILWAAPSGVDASTLVPYTDLATSVGPDSSTVILDMTDGSRVA